MVIKQRQELLCLGLKRRKVNLQCCVFYFFFLAFQVYLTAGKTYQLESTLVELEEGAQHSGTTDSELSELEDKVASAAARVQQAENEVRAAPRDGDSKRSRLGVF